MGLVVGASPSTGHRQSCPPSTVCTASCAMRLHRSPIVRKDQLVLFGSSFLLRACGWICVMYRSTLSHAVKRPSHVSVCMRVYVCVPVFVFVHEHTCFRDGGAGFGEPLVLKPCHLHHACVA